MLSILLLMAFTDLLLSPGTVLDTLHKLAYMILSLVLTWFSFGGKKGGLWNVYVGLIHHQKNIPLKANFPTVDA